MNASLPQGYALRQGTSQDRGRLRTFVQALFEEQGRQYVGGGPALDTLVSRQFEPRQTPLWWVTTTGREEIACLWLGRATDQFTGLQSTYVYLLYVQPGHRRRGIGRFLLDWASDIARDRGDSQLTLQSLPDNEAALALYQQMGFTTRALFLSRSLESL